MKETKDLKPSFKDCPKCHKNTCLVYIQIETEDEPAEASETCASCGYSNIIYDQYAEATKQMKFTSKEGLDAKKLLRQKQLREAKRRQRENDKKNNLFKVEIKVNEREKDIIQKYGIEKILKVFSESIKWQVN